MAHQQPPRKLRAFLCHSSGDKPAVRTLYHQLQTDGVDPWLDAENLLPGQRWQREIPKAVRASDVVIVCLSRSSIAKTGYVQKEITDALDVAEEQPEDAIYLIPARLEDCEVPDRLRDFQWVDLYSESGYALLLRALQKVAAQTEGVESDTIAAMRLSPRQETLSDQLAQSAAQKGSAPLPSGNSDRSSTTNSQQLSRRATRLTEPSAILIAAVIGAIGAIVAAWTAAQWGGAQSQQRPQATATAQRATSVSTGAQAPTQTLSFQMTSTSIQPSVTPPDVANPTIVDNSTVLRTSVYWYRFSGQSNYPPGRFGGKPPTNGRYLMVVATVANAGSTLVQIPDGFFVIKDAQGRVYDFNRAASVDYFNRFGGMSEYDYAADAEIPYTAPLGTMPLLFDIAPDATDLVIFSRDNASQVFLLRQGAQ